MLSRITNKKQIAKPVVIKAPKILTAILKITYGLLLSMDIILNTMDISTMSQNILEQFHRHLIVYCVLHVEHTKCLLQTRTIS